MILTTFQYGAPPDRQSRQICTLYRMSGGLDLYLQIQNQSGALRVDAFVKYVDFTCLRDPRTAPARYIYVVELSLRRARRDTGDGVESVNRLD